MFPEGGTGTSPNTPASPAANTAASITGKWQTEFDSQVGQQKYTYEFKADGEKLTGKATGQIGEEKRAPVELKDGKVKGDDISFVEVFEFNGMEITITYTGKIKGDEIRMTRKVGDIATEEVVAKRVKDEK
jgi:hypothetical protein